MRPLLPYFYSLYADEAALYFGDDVLKSREGCQQGCSLGTLLYVLSILPVILKLMEEFPDCMILGYSDDYYICGPPEEAAACLRRYGVLLAERDQRLKFSKSWAYSASAAALSHADIVALPSATTRTICGATRRSQRCGGGGSGKGLSGSSPEVVSRRRTRARRLQRTWLLCSSRLTAKATRAR